MTTHTPKVSPGMQETIDRLYELSGSKASRPDFMGKLFAPVPMEAELAAAGLSPQEARFIAVQLARNGYTIAKSEAQS